MEEIDINKIVSNFISDNLKSIVEIAKNIFKDANDDVLLHLKSTYESYLNETSLKYSRTKSFFVRNTSVYLYEFYVPITVSLLNKIIKDPNFTNITERSNKLVIVGTGGCGKSVLMKHILLTCIESKKHIPVFIELRDLNSKKISLMQLINEALNSNTYAFDSSYIDKAIRVGHFAFLLDGFDEVGIELRKKLITEIKNLANIGDKCPIIISSRPDEVFCGIQELDVFHVEAMSQSAACALVSKLPYDHEIKKNFINELKGGMYKKHSSFLSNPLLLSIMLLTYGQNAEIPTKLSIFYNQAYEALFQRHDALKGGYKRERCTSLDMQDFAKVFSVFCLLTYDKRLFGFSRIEALDFIEKSKTHLSLFFLNENYLEDALKATCLLIEDGIEIVFSHRSFQEYFVAYYINNAPPKAQEKLITKYWKHIRSDSVLLLLYEMNSGLVERLLLIPFLSKLFKDIGVNKKVGITHYVKYLKRTYEKINFDAEGLSATFKNSDSNESDLLHFLIRIHNLHRIEATQYKESLNSLFQKYGDIKRRNEYKTKTLTHRTPLILDLASSFGVFSQKYLQSGYEALKNMQKKHKNIESCLDELLKT